MAGPNCLIKSTFLGLEGWRWYGFIFLRPALQPLPVCAPPFFFPCAPCSLCVLSFACRHADKGTIAERLPHLCKTLVYAISTQSQGVCCLEHAVDSRWIQDLDLLDWWWLCWRKVPDC